MDAPTNNNVFGQRAKLYIQQRGFVFAATRAYKTTNNDANDANDILRELKGYKCQLYSAKYASFLHAYTLKRSLKSLKLFFLLLEAGVIEQVLPNDEDTVSIKIDEISWKEEENRRRKRRHYSPPTNRTQRRKKKVPLLPTPPPQHAAQMSTDMTLHTMMMRNIEALKYQCSTVLSTEDYMKFIFGH